MNYSFYRFTLDMQSNLSQVSLPVKLNDTGRRLLVGLTDGGNPYTMSSGSVAKLTYRKAEPNANGVYETGVYDCVLEDNNNTIRFDLVSAVTNLAGVVDCEIRLYGPNGRLLTSPRFILTIDERVIYNDDIPITEEQATTIDAIILVEEDRKRAETQRVTAETERVKAENMRARNATEVLQDANAAVERANEAVDEIANAIASNSGFWGTYHEADPDAVAIFGNGTSDTDRNNAAVIKRYGAISAGGTYRGTHYSVMLLATSSVELWERPSVEWGTFWCPCFRILASHTQATELFEILKNATDFNINAPYIAYRYNIDAGYNTEQGASITFEGGEIQSVYIEDVDEDYKCVCIVGMLYASKPDDFVSDYSDYPLYLEIYETHKSSTIDTSANGVGSSAVGIGAVADNDGSSAHGIGIIAQFPGEMVSGQFNKVYSDEEVTAMIEEGNYPIRVVGDGADADNRHDAFEIWLDGTIKHDGKVVASEDFVNGKIDAQKTETWTFTLDDDEGTITSKAVLVK